MPSLDLHVIQHPDSAQYWDRCMNSVRVAAASAPYPVHVYVVPAERYTLMESRIYGYHLGQSPWKTSVDDDDYLDPGALAALAPYLQAPYAGLYTDCARVVNGRVTPIRGRAIPHHLCAIRADVVDRIAARAQDYGLTDAQIRYEELQRDPRGYYQIPYLGYYYCLNANSPGKRDQRRRIEQFQRGH